MENALAQIISREITVTILDFRELNDPEKDLFRLARTARDRTQAPYSHYLVGCAVEDIYGNIATGCNVENVNLSGTIHAEENALGNLIGNKGTVPLNKIVTIGSLRDVDINFLPRYTHLSPFAEIFNFCPACGKCLQTIVENCFDPADGKFNPNVLLYGYLEDTGMVYRTTIGDALPMPFLPQYLGVDYSKYKK
jgi:cytidine deaminase